MTEQSKKPESHNLIYRSRALTLSGAEYKDLVLTFSLKRHIKVKVLQPDVYKM